MWKRGARGLDFLEEQRRRDAWDTIDQTWWRRSVLDVMSDRGFKFLTWVAILDDRISVGCKFWGQLVLRL